MTNTTHLTQDRVSQMSFCIRSAFFVIFVARYLQARNIIAVDTVRRAT